MRINNRESMAGINIINNHVLQHSGLAHSGLAQNIHMPAPIIGLNSKTHLLVAKISQTKQVNFVFMIVAVFNRHIVKL